MAIIQTNMTKHGKGPRATKSTHNGPKPNAVRAARRAAAAKPMPVGNVAAGRVK